MSGTEIKQRRLSGRRQISTSGRKLIDGTPFGRSFLRPAPDRPSLTIPARKRRKIGQTEADAITVQAGSKTDYDSYNQGEDEEEEDEAEGSDNTSSEKSLEVIERRLAPKRRIMAGKYTPVLEAGGEVEGNGGEYDNPLLDYYHDWLYGRAWERGTLKEIVEESNSSANKKGEESKEESDSSLEDEEIQLGAKNDLKTILDVGIDSHDSSEDEDFDPSSSQGEESDEEEHGEHGLPGEERPLATILGVIINSSGESDDEDCDPREVMPAVESSGCDEESASESDYTSSEPESESESESESEVVLFQPKK